jgi:hypothetical protein
VVLSSGCRRHRNQLAHGSKDTKVTDPNDKEAVDNTSSTTIIEALSEENSDSFPGDENSTAKSQNRHEPKVALSCQSMQPDEGMV